MLRLLNPLTNSMDLLDTMTNHTSIDTVTARLLAPGGVDEANIASTLDHLMSHHVDAADLYFQHSRSESWVLEDSLIKEGSHNIEQGVGVRAISGEKTGFAYSDEIVAPALLQAADAARSIARSGGNGRLGVWKRGEHEALYSPIDPAGSLSEKERLAILEMADEAARAADSRVRQVIASIAGEVRTVLVAASDGTMAGDIRPLVRMNVHVIVEDNGRREQASSGGGSRDGYGFFVTDGRAREYALEAVRQALVNLDARDAPAGTMPVVLGPGWPGVLLHEAVGHGLEGDFNRKGSSAFSGRVGELVANPKCTIVDDGTMPGRRGSLSVDDEGTPTSSTTLIEDGILVGYMQDRLNARLMGVAPTGNGRRESYAHLPMPRMTNTYMKAGQDDPADIIRSVKNGLYAVNFSGGQVDITSGKFVFSASEAYLIEDGKVTAPVKGATLIGNGPEAMHHISMVGHDLALDSGVGTCGKEGQSVPVGVGQPTLKVDQLTVGGTST
jgi:TldD protein